MQDWTFRVEDGVEILHVNEADYKLLPRTIENYMAGYPDSVVHEVIGEEDGKIQVRLGAKRHVVTKGTSEVITAHPQTVWCQPLSDETEETPPINNNTDGFVTG